MLTGDFGTSLATRAGRAFVAAALKVRPHAAMALLLVVPIGSRHLGKAVRIHDRTVDYLTSVRPPSCGFRLALVLMMVWGDGSAGFDHRRRARWFGLLVSAYYLISLPCARAGLHRLYRPYGAGRHGGLSTRTTPAAVLRLPHKGAAAPRFA